MSEPHLNATADSHNNSDPVAPRPRAGFKSRGPQVEMLGLFAGVLRAAIGVVGFVVALLFLSPNMATPVLTGVSLTLVVTGLVSIFRAVPRQTPMAQVPKAVLGLVVALLLGATALTVVKGAGAYRLRPVVEPDDARPAVRIDMSSGGAR